MLIVCHQGTTVSAFFHTSLLHIECAQQHGIIILFQHKFLHISIWKLIIYDREDWSRVVSSSFHSSSSISTLGSTRSECLAILTYQSVSALLHLGKSTASEIPAVEHFQSSLDLSGELCISSSCNSYPRSVEVSSRTCHKSTQNSNSSCTLLDVGFFTSHSSQHVGRYSLLVSYLMDILVGLVLKGLPLLHLPFDCSETCYTDKGSLPQSVRQWCGQLEHLEQSLWAMLERISRLIVQEGVPTQCYICP